MFEGTRKKASAQAKAKQQKPTMGIMGRGGGASPKSAADAGPAKPAAPPAPRDRAEEIATIGAAAIIRGDISGRGDLVIGGRVEGTVDLPDNDTNIEATGYMDGGVLAKNVNIRGKVQGDIEAKSKVTIFATGAMIGTIIAPRIQIEDGAKFKGRIDMGGPKPAPASKPAEAAKSKKARAPTASSG